MSQKSQNQLLPNKEFFDNEGFVGTLDAMARRYKKTPTELLEMTMYDFTLNVAIMLKALMIETKPKEKDNVDQKKPNWSAFGFDHEVK